MVVIEELDTETTAEVPTTTLKKKKSRVSFQEGTKTTSKGDDKEPTPPGVLGDFEQYLHPYYVLNFALLVMVGIVRTTFLSEIILGLDPKLTW
eukprot:Awhi_evm1s15231